MAPDPRRDWSLGAPRGPPAPAPCELIFMTQCYGQGDGIVAAARSGRRICDDVGAANAQTTRPGPRSSCSSRVPFLWLPLIPHPCVREVMSDSSSPSAILLLCEGCNPRSCAAYTYARRTLRRVPWLDRVLLSSLLLAPPPYFTSFLIPTSFPRHSSQFLFLALTSTRQENRQRCQ